MSIFDAEVLPALAAMLSVAAFAGFSRCYEPLTRLTSPLTSSALLYSIAGSLLLVAAGLSAFFIDFTVDLPAVTEAFAVRLQTREAMIAMFAGLVVAMSILYAIHIATEAYSRQTVNMGVYAILFQGHVIVLWLTDSVVHHHSVSGRQLLGGFLILGSGIGVLIAHQRGSVNGSHSPKAAVLGIFSAVACGLALYVDGEVGRYYIFTESLYDRFPAFLFYESLTFGLPALCVLTALFARHRSLFPLHSLRSAFTRHPIQWTVAGALSATHFLFAVFALSFPGSRFTTAMIFSTAPIANVILDRNSRSSRIRAIEYALSASASIGLFILLAYAN